jgi:hypothetical protein
MQIAFYNRKATYRRWEIYFLRPPSIESLDQGRASVHRKPNRSVCLQPYFHIYVYPLKHPRFIRNKDSVTTKISFPNVKNYNNMFTTGILGKIFRQGHNTELCVAYCVIGNYKKW